MQQGTQEWFGARKGRVTGSVAGAILGLNQYMTADDVLRRMVRDFHGADPEFTGNVATEYGSFHEDGAATEYEMETGNSIQKCGFFAHEEWLGASPDGLIGDDGLIEIKCPYGKRDGGEFKTAAEQPHYYAQMQIEMFCAGRKWCDFFQWSAHATRLERVNRDDTWLEENLPKLAEFYDRFIDAIEYPDDHLAPKRTEVDGAKAAALLEEYDDLTDALERASERKKEVLAELVQLAKERDAVICGRKLTKVEKEGAVSYARVVKENCPDIDLSKYRGKPSSFWKLS